MKFYLFLLQIILLGSILTVAKLLTLSSFSLFSRVSPALYLLGVLPFLLAPSVLDTASSTKMTDWMTGILVAFYILSFLASTLLFFGQYVVFFVETLEDLDPLKLVQEAWQGRFEASLEGEMRRLYYRWAVLRLTEVKCGARIYLSGRVLVLLAINLLQQAEGDWLGTLSVSLAQHCFV